jgi:GNAT superfamily N-acetyltransferase
MTAIGTPTVTLRPETEADRPFVRRLYATTREDELAAVPWTPEQKAAFLDMQFEAQRVHYRERIAGTRFAIVEVDGQPAGRLYVAESPGTILVVDIALLPEHRGRGIGTGLLQPILAHGRATGRPVMVHVEVFNPAIRLYERLGFRRVAEQGLYCEMVT